MTIVIGHASREVHGTNGELCWVDKTAINLIQEKKRTIINKRNLNLKTAEIIPGHKRSSSLSQNKSNVQLSFNEILSKRLQKENWFDQSKHWL